MNPKPLASIIINNYNYGRFLKEAIESALNQTYSHVEVIVVDDGSVDISRQVIESYGSRVFSVFKENGGQGSAFNAGFRLSRGEILCFLDADDFLLPNAMGEIARAFSENSPVKVQWRLNVIDASGRKTGSLMPPQMPPEGDFKSKIIQEGPFYDWQLTPPSSGNAYARSFIEKVFPMPEPSFRNGADVYLTVLAPVFGLLKTIDPPLGCYRSHGSNNYWSKSLDDARIQNYQARFEANSQALHHFLKQTGIGVDPETWKQTNINYVWPSRLLQAKEDIAQRIPAGETYILVNEDEWGNDGEAVSGRHALHFTELDGAYGGPPADDDAAIREFERLRSRGARYMVFWYTAFWWLVEYAGFRSYLNEKFSTILNNDRLIIFDLKSSLSIKA